MTAVQKVLDDKPSEWEDANYHEKTFHLFDITEGDPEFVKIAKPFFEEPRVNIKELKRVQNPFQLGRFVLRQSQKEHRGDTNVRPLIRYHPINRCDFEIALEYNMDCRRYRYKYATNQETKNPKFFITPQAAFRALPSGVSDEDKVIIVSHVLCESPGYDNEFMPLYVAFLE